MNPVTCATRFAGTFRPLVLATLFIALATAGLSGCRREAGPEFNIAGALSYLDHAGENAVYDGRVGGRLALGPQAPILPMDDTFGVTGPQVGARVVMGGSFRGSVAGRSRAGATQIDVTSTSNYFALSPQLTGSWRFPLGRDWTGGWFIEPGIGGGPVFAWLSFPEAVGAAAVDRRSVSDSSWAANPFVRVGTWSDIHAVGVEAGWQRTGLDFGHGLDRDTDEWYLGFFLGIRMPF